MPTIPQPSPARLPASAALQQTTAACEQGLVRESMAALADAIQPGAAATLGGSDPLLAACRLVCGARGIVLATPLTAAPENGEGLAALSERFGFTYRSVSLRSEWYRRDGGALLARSVNGTPVALLRRGRSYFICDPASSREVKVDKAAAAGIAPDAALLYRRLPDSPAGARSLVCFALSAAHGQGRILIFAGLAIGLLAIALPLAAGILFGVTVENTDFGQLTTIVAGLMALTIARAAYELVVALTVLRIRSQVEQALYVGLWERLLRLPTSFFRSFQVGDLAGRSQGVVELAQHGALLPAAILGVLGSMCSAVLMIALGGSIGLLCLILLITFHAVAALTAMSGTGLVDRKMATQALLDSFGLQMIELIAKLKVGGAERRAFAIWTRLYAAVAGFSRRSETRDAAAAMIFGELPFLLAIAAFAALAGQPTTFGLGRFVAFIVAMAQVSSAAAALAAREPAMIATRQVYRRMRPLLQASPEDCGHWHGTPRLEGRVAFDRVSFGYQDGAAPLIDGVSFVIEPGEMVAIVGPSGAGKTTLIRLLLGFEHPSSGAVLLDDQNLAHLDLHGVRRQMGVVLQNGGLIGASIYQNIAAAAPLDPEIAWAAARQAGLSDDIAAMPMGMNTRIDGSGSLLSGGQRQRLMLARALARRPRILVLDEATSALDNKTQYNIVANLSALGITRVVVAHRLSSVRNADRILVVEHGRLVQCGSFDELMSQSGPFAGQVQRQLA